MAFINFKLNELSHLYSNLAFTVYHVIFHYLPHLANPLPFKIINFYFFIYQSNACIWSKMSEHFKTYYQKTADFYYIPQFYFRVSATFKTLLAV